MKKYRIKHSRQTIVHFEHPLRGNDGLTLCGETLIGSAVFNRPWGKETTNAVTCENCQIIVSACLTDVSPTDISKTSRTP